jgi:hypothetical protein
MTGKYSSCAGEPGGARTRRPILGSVTYEKHEPTDPIKAIVHAEIATCPRHGLRIKHSPECVVRLLRGPAGRGQIARTRRPSLRVAGLSHDGPAARLFGRQRYEPAPPLGGEST